MTRFLLLLIAVYQAALRPLLGSRCRFHPSCSDYAREALAVKGALAGCRLVVMRLLRCHPFHPGGFDPVPHHG